MMYRVFQIKYSCTLNVLHRFKDICIMQYLFVCPNVIVFMVITQSSQSSLIIKIVDMYPQIQLSEVHSLFAPDGAKLCLLAEVRLP